MTGLVDEGTAVDVFYMDFNKAHSTVSHKILLEDKMQTRCVDCTNSQEGELKSGWIAKPQMQWSAAQSLVWAQ